MQEEIIQYLQETYTPQSIILHGSRASGMEREHSDWDFILLFADGIPNDVPTREFYKEEHIEIYSVQAPTENIFDTFGTKLSSVQLLFDTDNLGLELLYEAQKVYSKGPNWDESKVYENKLWVMGRVDGMRDTTDNPMIFNKYFSDFYVRLHNYWYIILHNQHSKPIYLALPEIKEKDPNYYKILNSLSVNETSLSDKVLIADKIVSLLFKN